MNRIMTRFQRRVFAATLPLAMFCAGAASAATYTLTVLPTLRTDGTGEGTACSLNDAGLVVGRATNNSAELHIFRWTSGGGMVDAGTLIPPYSSIAFGVNASGELCGYGITQSGGFASAVRQATAGPLVDLSEFIGGGDSIGNAIADDGTIVGWGNHGIGCGAPECTGNPGHAARWVGISIFPLPELGGYFSDALGISPDGSVICGYGANPGGQIRAFRLPSGAGSPSELAPLPGFANSYATAVNNLGEIVGYSYNAPGTNRATLWTATTPIDLGLTSDAVSTVATSINGHGDIVGYSILADATNHAVKFSRSSAPVDLNTLIAPGSGWTLRYANDINGAGPIVGEAFNSGGARAMLLTPVIPAGVESPSAGTPGVEFRAPSPNPLISGTTLSYALPSESRVRVLVLDVAGRELARLLDQVQSAGDHVITWDGRDAHGRALDAGVYFTRLEAAGTTRMQRLVIAR